ncbi:hypothetical protein BC830DRAFT_1116304 [Chytriomyces sp. MP71]|nr:hypothetical protein BC830DRAFT_1116304 [Chytriomyces sp. MP71]
MGKDKKDAAKSGGKKGGGKRGKKGDKPKPYSYTYKKDRHGKPIVQDLVSYDDASRSDYLTGFHKRKLEKIKKAKERDAALEREAVRESRKEKRNKLSGVFDEIERIESLNEEARKNKQSQDVDAADMRKVVVEKRLIANGNKMVTVTIEELE